ncbi:MAG TPA: MarC family protein [Spirochaetota bacterium]|nr:MarC family protein [Spirochaetota bacterium]HPS86529.1 MarC family protein [Spirochaetota bacterium]
MDQFIYSVLDCTLALIALINPISKIFLITTLKENTGASELRHIIVRSSIIALLILLTFTFIGNFLLIKLFHIQIYSFKIAGGIVLIFRGFEALNKGLFFELNSKQKLEDLSIVPLASPMIAGPATITAAVSFPAKYGMTVTSMSILAAVAANLLIMIISPRITGALTKHNVMGALIRITGLIVATIGVQMILDGFGEYLHLVIRF